MDSRVSCRPGRAVQWPRRASRPALDGGLAMRLVPETDAPQRPPTLEEDPSRYGWRYVPARRPDGTVDLDHVPLTLEDVLHPQEGDFIVNNYGHHEDCEYLYAVIQA